MYLNQLNLFDSIESIWLNWIILKWLNLFETIFKLIDYKVPRTTMKKDFSRQISKSWISGNFKIKIRILHSKKHQKNFLWFFPDFSVKYFWESIWFHKSYWIPDYIQRKILKNIQIFFPSNRKVLNEIKINFKIGFFTSNFENWIFSRQIAK